MKHRNGSKSTYVALGRDKSRKLVKTRSKPERKQSSLQTKKNAAKNAEDEGTIQEAHANCGNENTFQGNIATKNIPKR